MSNAPAVFHLGLHKTGTTSLQMHLFRAGERPYHGLHGAGDWLLRRRAWFSLLDGTRPDLPDAAGDGFVFSDESVLLRFGGIEGSAQLARRIMDACGDARLLVTIREPVALLVSAYYQSLRLRMVSLGFSEGRPCVRESMRFTGFAEWCERLLADPGRSLAGLLEYERLRESLCAVAGNRNVVMLPLEWIRAKPGLYVSGLRSLGFADDGIARLLAAPAENARGGRRLHRLRPWAYDLGHRLQQAAPRVASAIGGNALLRRMADGMIYSGAPQHPRAGAPPAELVAALHARFDAQWQDFEQSLSGECMERSSDLESF